jgi:hypothetical protein
LPKTERSIFRTLRDFSSGKVAVCYNNYNNDNSYNHYRRGYGGNTFNGYQHAVAH